MSAPATSAPPERSVTPSREEFRRIWEAGGAPPVWREVLADCETPVSAFRKIQGRGSERRHAFLLESVEGGEVWGRYSILGAGVRTVFTFAGGRGVLARDGRKIPLASPEPLGALREALRPLRRSPSPEAVAAMAACAPPPPFRGGAVGWLNYDAVRHYAPVRPPKGRGSSDSMFLLPEAWLVFDRLRSRIAMVAETAGFRAEQEGAWGGARPDSSGGTDPDAAWEAAALRLDVLESRLSRSLPPAAARETPISSRGGIPPQPALLDVGPFDVPDELFRRRVERAKEYIRAGDVIQVVLSRRREGEFRGDPLDVYRALRLINPSPYMFYLRAGKDVLSGSSPEALVRVEGSTLTSRPIAGTRPRGRDPVEDAARASELAADAKEKAEHLMLVDLGRNDLGRVAKIGSVRVPDFMRVERYSHVMHLVSDVTAELAGGLDAFDAVRSVFPAGTLSGAPKIRAMQIVSELEGKRRGAYGGLVGWFDPFGNADTCIAIRMVQMRLGSAAGGGSPTSRFTVQAGAGIVYDSDPQSEAEETEAKSEGVIKALELAARGLR